MNLNQNDWASQLESDNNAVILDVRTQEETLEGVIRNAINIDIYKGQGFIYDVDVLDKSKNYYVYCKAGSRSEQACRIMNELGFEKHLQFNGWHVAVEWRCNNTKGLDKRLLKLKKP